MADKLAFLTATWALLLAPALCRAGLLQACCMPAQPREQAVADADQCCEKEHPSPKEPPERRDCGACADLCYAAVKAPTEDQHIDFAQAMLSPHTHDLAWETFTANQAYLSHHLRIPGINMPYPQSDTPLLI